MAEHCRELGGQRTVEFAGQGSFWRRLRLPTIHLNGIRIHAIDEQTCIEHLLDEIDAGRGGFVVTPNVDHLRRCRNDMSFSALVAEANLVVADGMPLIWASRLQATPLPQRVAGSDLISSLSAEAAKRGRSVFLLGGVAGTAEAAAKILREKYPTLRIAGTLCPEVGFENDITAMGEIAGTLQTAKPDVVYVGLGSPKQELVIDRIRRLLPQAWWLGVGVSFSFLCGDVKRAPTWMRTIGLEWLHRFAQEPRRLGKRYLVGIPFAGVMLGRALLRGIPNRIRPKPRVEEFSENPSATANEIATVNEIAARLESEARVSAAPARIAAEDAIEHDASTAFTERPHISMAETRKIRELILLGGAVRSSPLAASLERNVLDLPCGKGKTMLMRWLEEAASTAQMLEMSHLPVRLLLDNNAVEPRSAVGEHYRMERDSDEYRGTGGLLANLAKDYDENDMILVGNAAQVLLDPLAALVLSLKRTKGAVALIGHRDGEPSGLMMVSCKALRLIPKVGFVDMKEQALPIIARHCDIRVVQCRRPTGLAVRTLSDYIGALRALHQPIRATATDPWAEEWKSTFTIVETGATVDPSARIHDSVILSGANVESGAVIVRCVVDGIVKRDRKVVDQSITPVGKRPAGGFASGAFELTPARSQI